MITVIRALFLAVAAVAGYLIFSGVSEGLKTFMVFRRSNTAPFLAPKTSPK